MTNNIPSDNKQDLLRGDILVVDDTPANLQLLVTQLTRLGYKVRAAADGQLALMAAESKKPDLILLDIMMPGIDGFEVCRRLKANPDLKEVPILFISAVSEIDQIIQGFQLGAADYISKPFHIEEVVARVETHITLYRQRKELELAREQDRIYFEKLAQFKSEFVANASHDLKHPVTGLQLAIDFLQVKGHDPNIRARYLPRMQGHINRMKRLISDMLTLVKMETGRSQQFSTLQVTPFVETVVKDFSLQAKQKNIELGLMLQDQDIEMECDQSQMYQLFHNLLSNAIKYTPENGYVSVSIAREDPSVKMSFSDTGLGIPTDDLPHIFDRFYRVDNKKHVEIEGTGLGLAIVKTIVNQHSGNIWVESKIDHGSIFHIQLPIRQPHHSSAINFMAS